MILYCAIAFLEYSKVEVLKDLAEWQHVFCYCIGKFSISICPVLEVIEVVYEKTVLPRFPEVQTLSLTFSPGDSEDGSLEIKEALSCLGRWRWKFVLLLYFVELYLPLVF